MICSDGRPELPSLSRVSGASADRATTSSTSAATPRERPSMHGMHRRRVDARLLSCDERCCPAQSRVVRLHAAIELHSASTSRALTRPSMAPRPSVASSVARTWRSSERVTAASSSAVLLPRGLSLAIEGTISVQHERKWGPDSRKLRRRRARLKQKAPLARRYSCTPAPAGNVKTQRSSSNNPIISPTQRMKRKLQISLLFRMLVNVQ
jgi:hypothetical protein